MNRNKPRSNIRDHLGDEKRIEARSLLGAIVHHLLLKGLETSDTGGDDYPYTLKICLLEVETRIFEGLFGSNQSELCVAVVAASFFAIEVIVGIKSLHFAGKLRLKVRRIEEGDRTGTALPLEETFPRLRHTITHRGKCSKTRDNNSLKLHGEIKPCDFRCS